MNDPYFNSNRCFDRLYKEYKKHKKIIIAVDFDESVFDFKNKGDTYNKVISLLKECQKLNFYICIFTASKPERYNMMKDYMEDIGIKIDSININPIYAASSALIPLPYGNNGKMYYNILLDDKAGLKQSYDILSRLIKVIKVENLIDKIYKKFIKNVTCLLEHHK